MSDSLKEVCGYVRVSTDKQEELSPDSQIRLIKEYASSHNMLLNHIYIEEHGISGKNADKRPAFQKMIAMCKHKSHPYDAVLVWKFSRFARNIDESTYYKSVLRKKCNVDVISISEPVMEGMYGRLIEMVIEWSDEFYLYNLSGEVMRGMTQNALQGGYNSNVPLGYTKDKGRENIPRIDMNEAAIVKKIFDMYTLELKSLKDIAASLNSQGYTTRRGNRFETRTIGYILDNPFYIGKIRWNYFDRKNNKKKNSDDIILVDGKHEPVISIEQFEQAKLRRDSVKNSESSSAHKSAICSGHWLSGMIKCSKCGASLAYNRGCANGKQYPGFVCWKSLKGLCGTRNYINEKKASEEIINIIETIYRDTPKIACSYYEKIGKNLEHEYLKKQISSIDSKLLRAKEAYLKEVDTLEEYKSNKKPLLQQKENILKELKKYDTSENDAKTKTAVIDISDIINTLKDSNTGKEIKADIIRAMFEKFVWDREHDRMDTYLKGYIKRK